MLWFCICKKAATDNVMSWFSWCWQALKLMTIWLQRRKAYCVFQGWDRLNVTWASWQWETNMWLVCNFRVPNFLTSIQLSCLPLSCRGICMYSELFSAVELPNSESVVAVIKPICSVADLLERCYIRLFFWEVSLLGFWQRPAHFETGMAWEIWSTFETGPSWSSRMD